MNVPALRQVEQVSEGWLNKYELTYELPDHALVTYETVSRKKYNEYVRDLTSGSDNLPRVDAVCVVGHTSDDCFLLIREFRFPLNKMCVAFPAGLKDPEESVTDCASRELLEETGYDFVRDETGAPVYAYECVQPGYSSLGMSDESIAIVFAEVECVSEPHTEATEFIEVVKLPRCDVVGFLCSNTDPMSIRVQLILETLAMKPFGDICQEDTAAPVATPTSAVASPAINAQSYMLGAQGSAIRELFSYGLARKQEIGADNVFDFSLGNPSVAAPDEVRQATMRLLNQDPAVLHGYTPAQGDPMVRQVVADSLNRRFGTDYTAQNLYMTAGAAASIDISLHAVCNPGDEVIVIAPYFPEYRMWIESMGCVCVECLADTETFQVNPEVLAAAITPCTKAVIINSPNNPVGVVYSKETIEAVANVLHTAQQRLEQTIYLISDEPYRELVFDDAIVPWVPRYYDNTIVCYSWSKSLSLPGERIGYVLVPNTLVRHTEVYAAICGAGRSLGFVCAPALFQKVIAQCVDVPANIAAYACNREILCRGLRNLGYEYIEPQGAFYLWVRALEPNAQAFSDRAKKHELLLVPSDSFGVSGWVRIGYCVSAETIENSMLAFAALKKEYDQKG